MDFRVDLYFYLDCRCKDWQSHRRLGRFHHLGLDRFHPHFRHHRYSRRYSDLDRLVRGLHLGFTF
jgi:hypothetical protein